MVNGELMLSMVNGALMVHVNGEMIWVIDQLRIACPYRGACPKVLVTAVECHSRTARHDRRVAGGFSTYMASSPAQDLRGLGVPRPWKCKSMVPK